MIKMPNRISKKVLLLSQAMSQELRINNCSHIDILLWIKATVGHGSTGNVFKRINTTLSKIPNIYQKRIQLTCVTQKTYKRLIRGRQNNHWNFGLGVSFLRINGFLLYLYYRVEEKGIRRGTGLFELYIYTSFLQFTKQ